MEESNLTHDDNNPIKSSSDTKKKINKEKNIKAFTEFLEKANNQTLNSEDLLRRANSKFINRFKAIEKELVKRGKTIDEAKLDEMDEIWDKIKN